MDKSKEAVERLEALYKVESGLILGESGKLTPESLKAEREKDPVLDEQLTVIHSSIQEGYQQARQGELEALQEEGITEDELKTVADTSLSSCIFGDNNYTLDNAIDRMKQRFQDIVARIDSLEHGRYSRMSMVKNEVAMGLYLIHTEKLYLASNYKSAFEVAQDVLKFSRMTTSNYIRVAKRFIDKKRPVSIFYDGKAGIDFNISQLIQLLKLSDDEIRFCIEGGMLEFTTPVSAIKVLVKTMKENRDKEQAKQAEAAKEPFQAAYDEFHAAYNALKEHLLKTGDEAGANELLPKIMDAVCVVYAEGLQHLTDK